MCNTKKIIRQSLKKKFFLKTNIIEQLTKTFNNPFKFKGGQNFWLKLIYFPFWLVFKTFQVALNFKIWHYLILRFFNQVNNFKLEFKQILLQKTWIHSLLLFIPLILGFTHTIYLRYQRSTLAYFFHEQLPGLLTSSQFVSVRRIRFLLQYSTS